MKFITAAVLFVLAATPAAACQSWEIDCNGNSLGGGTVDGYGKTWNENLGGGYSSSDGQTWGETLNGGWKRSDGYSTPNRPLSGYNAPDGQNCEQTLGGGYNCQ